VGCPKDYRINELFNTIRKRNNPYIPATHHHDFVVG
jgi:hypothetical protein